MKLILGFFNKIRRDHADAYAAQSAFFTMISFVPFLMLLLSMFQYIPQSQDYFLELIAMYVPDYFEEFLVSVVNELYAKSIALTSLTAVFTVWTASIGILHLAEGLNAVYEIEETRPWIVVRTRAIINTLLMASAMIGLLVVMIFGELLHENLAVKFPWIRGFTEELLSNRVLILSVALTLIFAIFYKFLPNRRARFLGQLPGAFLCTVCWMVFSYLLSIYIRVFNGFSMYGSLMMIALILFWLYFCMYFIMIGGAVNFYFNALFRRVERWLRRRWRERRAKKLSKKQEASAEEKKESKEDE